MTVLASVVPEDVHAISAEVWASFLGASEDDPLLWADAPLPEGTATVCASVAIAGPNAAVVCLEMPRSVALAATRAMLGAPEDEDLAAEDVADAVGELVNMVGGNIKSLLPDGGTLGLPQVSEGPVVVPAAVEACAVDLAWQGRALRVRVWTAIAHHPVVEEGAQRQSRDHSPDVAALPDVVPLPDVAALPDVELVETGSRQARSPGISPHPEN